MITLEEPLGTVCPKCGIVANINGRVLDYAYNITEYTTKGFKRQLCKRCEELIRRKE